MATKARKRTAELKVVPRVESGMRDLEKSIQDLVDQIADVTSKSLYFGLGAAVLLKEGFEDFVDKAIKKGEDSEKDVIEKIKSRLKVERKPKKAETTFEARIEAGVRKVLDTFDIPSKSDVQKLSRRVAELSGRVNKLTQVQKRQA